MIKVCLVGIGKAGKEIAKLLYEQSDIKIVAAISNSESDKIGQDLGKTIGVQKIGIKIDDISNIEEVLLKNKPDVVVDFSSPESFLKYINILSELKINSIIGTTGFSNTELEFIKNITYENQIGVVFAPNITLGVNVLMLLSNIAALLLNDYDFSITEVHHKNKKDIPSGTAEKIANEIKCGLSSAGVEIANINIPIHSVRAGGIIGKHEVLIAGENDEIIISHESFSRKTFALGALKAIRFIPHKIGFYEMNDVLSLSKIIENLYI